jgi:GAF domain-containing protein
MTERIERESDSELRSLLVRAIRAAEANGGLVWARAADAEALRVVASAMPDKDYAGMLIKRGDGLVGRALAERAPRAVADYATWTGRSEEYRNEPIGPALVVPLLRQDELIGCLSLFRQPGAEPFDDDDIKRVNAVASQLGVELFRYEQLDNLGLRAEQLERALVETGKILSAHQELGVMLNALADTAKQLLRADFADIQLYDPDADALVSHSGRGERELGVGLRLPLMGLLGTVWSTRRALSVYDAQEDQRNPEPVLSARLGVRGFLGVPLLGERSVIGVLAVATEQPRLFSPNDETILKTFARYAASAIENARLATELHQRLEDVRVAREQTQSYARELASAVRQEQAHAQQLDTLRQISLKIATQQDLITLWQTIVEATRQLLGTESVALSLRRGDIIENVAATVPAWLHHQYHPGEGLTGRVIQTGESLIIENYAEYAGHVEIPKDAPPIGSVAIVPLVHRDQIIGTLSAGHTSDGSHTLTRDDLALLQHLAAQASVAIENARLLADLKSRVAQLNALEASALDVTSTLDLGQVLERIAARAQELLRADGAAIAILQESGQLKFVVDTGTQLAGQFVAVGQGLNGMAMQTGAPLIVHDYQQWARRLPAPTVANLRGGIAVPLRVRERVIGALDVFTMSNARAQSFNDADAQMLTQLAAQAAIAIENARLYEQNQIELKLRSTAFQEARRRMLNSLRSTLDLLAVQKEHAANLTVERVIETTRAHLEELNSRPEFRTDEGSFIPLHELARAVGRESINQRSTPQMNVDLIVDGDAIYLDLHQANILWLILRELTAHALDNLRDAPRGILHITTRSGRERSTLSVEDDGSATMDATTRSGGLALVERLVTQDLHGEFRVQPRRNQRGSQAAVTWQLAAAKPDGEMQSVTFKV